MTQEPQSELVEQFFAAITERDAWAVRDFIAAGVSPNQESDLRLSALYLATYNDDHATMIALLDGGADPNFIGTQRSVVENHATPLNYACEKGLRSATMLLLERGADPLIQARFGRNAAFMLLSAGKAGTKNSVLWKAHASKAVERMLDAGLDPNYNCEGLGGASLLSKALSKGLDTKTICNLIDRGADTLEIGSDGSLVIHRAAYRGRIDVVALLVERGQAIDALDSRGRTPLFYHYKPETAAALLEMGADINHQDAGGNTVLHYAIEGEGPHKLKDDAILNLLELGARTDVRNNAGKTALDVAKREASNEIFAVVAAASARQVMATAARAAASARAVPGRLA